MTEARAILLLFDLLTKAYDRPIRVLDLYHYLRHVLAPGILPPEWASLLRNYNSSRLFLVLEQLRTEGFVAASGSTFILTELGEQLVNQLRTEYSPAVVGLSAVAARLAA